MMAMHLKSARCNIHFDAPANAVRQVGAPTLPPGWQLDIEISLSVSEQSPESTVPGQGRRLCPLQAVDSRHTSGISRAPDHSVTATVVKINNSNDGATQAAVTLSMAPGYDTGL
jgi:hypothetical protein